MADFVPPPGPPPPTLPAGYKAVWNDQYNAWFYVNIYTKKSQWDKPTQPVYPDGSTPPPGPPPGFAGGADTKNPYVNNTAAPDSDAALAARLQAEENARGSSRDAQSDYQNTPMPQTYPNQPPVDQQRSKGGFLGKLFGGKSSASPQQYGAPQQQYRPQQQYGGGYPTQGFQQQNYSGYPPQGGYGGPPPGGYGGGGGYGGYAQPPQPAKSGGMGVLGGAALGVGGGLIGGMLIEDAIDDHDQNEQQEGYNQGYEQGEDNQQNYDDGNGGGGDFGGDDGGGDF